MMASNNSSSKSSRARVVRLEEYASSGAMSDHATPARSSSSVGAARSKSRASESSSHGRVPASASHRLNDKYMDEFDAAYEELHAAASGATKSSSSAAKRAATRQSTPVASSSTHERELDHHDQTSDALLPAHTHVMSDLQGAWVKGPSAPEGTLHAVSAQPLMCMSMSADGREVVVGSSDHALYAIPLATPSSSSSARARSTSNSKSRTLYSKKFGHSEWVTCVTHLRDQRVVSGGMDSKLCLWDATGVKCEDLVGHSGSVSLIRALATDDVVVSASYDKTVRVWHVGKHTSSRQRERSVVKAAAAPILDASVVLGDQALVCGDRDGSVYVVDLAAAKVVQKLSNAHRGHTTSVRASSHVQDPSTFYSGGQDGVVKVWDSRQRGAALETLTLHVDAASGKCGAVGFLCEPQDDPNVLVTGGADGSIKVLDKRASYRVVYDFTEHLDFIYALHIQGQLCLSGAGNGMLHVHDWKRGTLLYGLGANQAAVRAIGATASQLVAAGDDGGVVVYDMQS